MTVFEARQAELADWDAVAVDAPGGHVYQSMAWARHRATTGWRPRFLVIDDGGRVLALVRPWPVVGGGSAYIPRGPVPAGAEPATTLIRLLAATEWLAGHGIDVVASDAEVLVASGYGEQIRAAGFKPIAEIQPSRHTMKLGLGRDADDASVRATFSKSTRQRISAAERSSLAVARYDTAGWTSDRSTGGLLGPPVRDPRAAFDTFFALLESTGERRGFRFGPRAQFVDWWQAAHDAGHLVYLEANDGPTVVGGLVLYRHGGRLSTVHSADRADARADHPGVMHLLRWRAIQLAIREGCDEMDLGGVDVGPDHREPQQGDPMFGLYEHKRSFGATWQELVGAHERVIRPARYGIGRALARVARAGRR